MCIFSDAITEMAYYAVNLVRHYSGLTQSGLVQSCGVCICSWPTVHVSHDGVHWDGLCRRRGTDKSLPFPLVYMAQLFSGDFPGLGWNKYSQKSVLTS